MLDSTTRDHQEASMPAKGRRNPKASPPVEQGDTTEPGRFTAGTGALAEDMQKTFAETAVQAQSIRLQKLDGDALPVGEPVTLEGATATVHMTPTDLSDVDLPQPASTIEFETSDPATVALARELLRIPVPTAVICSWWPAIVRLPNDPHPWSLCKVFLTPQGLYVYRQPPAAPETFTAGATPDWYTGVDFEKTRRPVTGTTARNAGIPIVTAAGQVIVQPTSGCGCANRALKNWRPTWSRNVISWDDGVRLAIDATEGR
jgi:hypothetical protein